MTQPVVLLEGAAEWEESRAIVAHWDASDVPASHISLPQLVDHNADGLTVDYLRWIHDCGEAPVYGGTLRTATRLGDSGLSAWWMSLMAEKSPMKTRTVFTVLKLRAFEILCEAEEATGITYVGGDARLAAVLQRWCSDTGRAWRHVSQDSGHDEETLGRRVTALPHTLRGLAWFAWWWWTRVRPVRKRRNAEDPGFAPDAAVVTYFPNCDMAALKEGRFRSSYWLEAHDLFDRMPGGVDWIWMYAPSDAVPISAALDHRDACNAADGKQRFHLLEEFVSPGVLLRAVGAWFSLARRAGGLIRQCGATRLPDSRLDLAPVLHEDWKASLRGIVAAEAAYYHAAFAAMAGTRPIPARALYVFENQPWELALVDAWKGRGVETVVAHQHEAMKPLNLRLFDDPRTLSREGAVPKPLPDILAIGSDYARETFLHAGWKAECATLVESLRFRTGNPVSRSEDGRQCLLLVTGYLAPETRVMLEMTAEADATGALGGYDGIRIKPHPFLPVDDMVAALAFASPVEIVTEPLDRLWPETGFAFMANSTAAVLEALAAGIPSAVCAPQDDFNLSPAVGMDVSMIARAETLAIAAQARSAPAAAPDFCYEPDLPRWAALLGIVSREAAEPTRLAGQRGG